MKRRDFIRGLSLLPALSMTGANAQFGLPLAPPTFPAFPVLEPPGMRVSVNITQMTASVDVQRCPEWCWATSISMIFAFHGHRVDQQRIVAETYPQLPPGANCIPAGSSTTIAQDLSRSWVDDLGRPFTSQVVAAYDVFNNIYLMNNAIIVNELQNNRPLLYCNTHHAMVMCSLAIGATPYGPRVTEIDVVDPFPLNPRIHPLSIPEGVPAQPYGGQMTFLAAVSVTSQQ